MSSIIVHVYLYTGSGNIGIRGSLVEQNMLHIDIYGSWRGINNTKHNIDNSLLHASFLYRLTIRSANYHVRSVYCTCNAPATHTAPLQIVLFIAFHIPVACRRLLTAHATCFRRSMLVLCTDISIALPWIIMCVPWCDLFYVQCVRVSMVALPFFLMTESQGQEICSYNRASEMRVLYFIRKM